MYKYKHDQTRHKHNIQSKKRPVVAYPKPFTACAQQLRETGAWVAPSAERPGEWLVLRPVLLPPGDGGGGAAGGGGDGPIGGERSEGECSE